MSQQASFTTFAGTAAENYERYFVPAIGAPLAADLVELAALRRGERVLDVACGTGIVARQALERVGDGGLVVGTDINPGMLGVARDALPESSWREANAEDLPFRDDAFDVVFCQMGLQFFADKPAAARELRRVLVPGGRLFVNVPGPTPRLFGELEEALARHLGSDVAGFVRAVFSFHDPAELRDLLSSAGFEQVKVRSNPVTLRLAAPENFLWRYVHSTPLGTAVAQLDEDGRIALEREVVAAWRPFTEDGMLILQVSLTTASAR
jgi:ubiquinone/menaquinone biosynthesis C-methylase UbiE